MERATLLGNFIPPIRMDTDAGEVRLKQNFLGQQPEGIDRALIRVSNCLPGILYQVLTRGDREWVCTYEEIANQSREVRLEIFLGRETIIKQVIEDKAA